jgi:hypothetical protein
VDRRQRHGPPVEGSNLVGSCDSVVGDGKKKVEVGSYGERKHAVNCFLGGSIGL